LRLRELQYSQFNREPAALLSRFIAMILDFVVLASLLFFSSFMLYFIFSRYGARQEYFYGILGFIRFNIIFIGVPALLIAYVYYGAFYSSFGATPGKMFMGLRVVDFYSGENLGLIQILFREFFGKWLSAAILFFGYFLSVMRKDGRALHDFFSSSQVISDWD